MKSLHQIKHRPNNQVIDRTTLLSIWILTKLMLKTGEITVTTSIPENIRHAQTHEKLVFQFSIFFNFIQVQENNFIHNIIL